MRSTRFGKRTLLTALFLVTVLTWAATAQTEIIHYSYGSHGDAWHNYLRTMAERFEDETGIAVNIMISGGPADYRDKLFTMIAVGAAPDVTDANPVLAGAFLGHGSFADLRPYIERDGFPLDEIPPAVLEGVQTPDGAIWGLPVSLYPVFTMFNIDLFHAAGVPTPAEMEYGWTWDALSNAARRLTYDADGDGVIDVYATSRFYWRWEMQVHQAGGQLYDRLTFPTESRFNSPEVLEAIEFLRDLVVTSPVNAPNYRTHDLSMGNVAFTVVDGPGTFGDSMRDVSFEWDIAMQPKGPGSRASRVNPDGFQILADSMHPEAAWEWVKFLTADIDNQLQMASLTGRLPSLREAMMAYPEVSPKLPSNWLAMVETAFDPDGYTAYVLDNATVIDPIVNTNLNKVWQGIEAPSIALQQIHELVSRALAEQLEP